MTKTAFIFPGQGSQRVGMGADLLETHPDVFDRLLELADASSGLPIRKLCLEGPIESLTSTEVAQPALFAVSLAVAEVAQALDLTPDFVAGHSLGEYTAAVVCGALSVPEGMRLVAERGRLMAEIQSERPGSMAAVIGLDAGAVEELCALAGDAGVVAPANLNSPAQIVVSGEDAAVARLVELAREAGAKKAVPLQVGAAFHSELMKPVQRRLSETMSTLSWSEPRAALASNALGALVDTAEGIREALIAQIASPVRWVDCVKTLAKNGCTTFLELGPGRVLSGLVRQIDPQLRTFAADSEAKLAEFASQGGAV